MSDFVRWNSLEYVIGPTSLSWYFWKPAGHKWICVSSWFSYPFQSGVIFTLLIVALCVGWMRSCVIVNPFDNETSIFVDSHSVQIIPEFRRWEILKFCVNEINWTFLTSFLERTTYEVSHSYKIPYKTL